MKFTFQLQQDQQTSGPFKHKLTYMAGKDVPKQFRILPAYSKRQDGTPDPHGWIPFETEDEVNTPWLFGYQIWPNIGHGAWGRAGNRKSFIRFDLMFPEYEFDAVSRVVNAARNNQEWRYLFDKPPAQGTRVDTILRWYPQQEMLANVVILSAANTMPRTVLGSFSASLTRQLCGGQAVNGEAEEGIINRLSNLPDEYIKQNRMLRYWLGDITDPNEGVVLEIYRDESAVPARYRIRPLRSDKGGAVKTALTAQMMEGRVDLSDPHNIAEPPEPQEEVNRVASCLNEWSPDGRYHEFELLKLAFPEFSVPNPPAKGTVNGFVPPQAEQPMQAQMQPEPATNVMQPLPPPAQPAPAPAMNTTPVAPPNAQLYDDKDLFPAMQPPAQPTPAPAPVAPAAPASQPAPQPQFQQPQFQQGQFVQFQPQVQAQIQTPAPAPAPQPQAFDRMMPQVPAEPQQPVQPPAPAAPMPQGIPGNAVPKFNASEFMARFAPNGGGQQ